MQGSTPPDVDSETILIEGEPLYVIHDVDPGQFFSFYVRAICEDDNETTKTPWVGPIMYSYFIPPICANLDAGIEGMPSAENDTYILCDEGPVSKTLNAHYIDIKQTSDYQVDEIEFNPPYPFFGGDMVRLTRDDQWSDIIDLGFDFCFYGNSYDKILISTNGAITFSIEGEVDDGRYQPFGWSEWRFNQQIPFASPGDWAPFLNTVFGVMQDLDPNFSPLDHSVNYQVLGYFPCRALVFNIYHLGLYNFPFYDDDIEGSTQTSQIVLYEATNIIEVYVKNRPVYPEYTDRHNDGNGVLGIQNADGTRAHYPGMYEGDTKNRNTGDWVTQNEAWRFTPNGESTVNFNWYKDGDYFSSEEIINVEITESTTFTAKAVYLDCKGDEMIIQRDFHFLKEDVAVDGIPDYQRCGTSDSDHSTSVFTISEIENYIREVLGNEVIEKHEVLYYLDEALTQPLEGDISVEGTETIYLKFDNILTQCTKIKSLDLVYTPFFQITTLENVAICEAFLLPPLQEGERYFTQANGEGMEYSPGDIYEKLGRSTLYIYKQLGNCVRESHFEIVQYETLVVDHLDDQYMQCENFVLPPLSEGNAYYTEPNAGGIRLNEGMEIMLPMTIYIYTAHGQSTVVCYEESSFDVHYEDCPIPRGFSPNGDGINDSFDLSEHAISKIQIFNRHGREVYAKDTYFNEFVGKDKSGNKLPAGTYYYVVTSHGKQRTGWVEINY